MTIDLTSYDDEQVRLMEEMCILLDENDNRIGAASKKVCHLMENINKGMLHRAFSVFLFNSKNELLLQQRATEKITFPDMFTNTCCSHPLDVPSELVEAEQLGAKVAAQRKLEHELGIKPEQIPLEKFHYLTRIHYLAPSDGTWGEHEIDYIFFVKADVDLDVNENEVRSIKYITPTDLKQLFADSKTKDVKITPWFKLICETFLFKWWSVLEEEGEEGIKKLADPETIHRL
ncbi:isopentenyl pyrophosphate isomerase [Conidiobolus coronatus NRRL 28638]|uniref:isopentenyl-diphosphate Delta-isomerase n=1 Tax=Conidiobolus coronatus (strain ATCC 28846 / CBS 209.66 / NRRL 28638) TaxID=796925 RepID=A0A137P9U9_CONC2|nr:isopentenyl pyrophosphate isomerase [Conidiobolus coronatus NRRL 28638]|eukprot:KXN71788.1 isopentenyl pyrophosphate isomerase [Conidiobolus coronatus NRRL 28638]